ncbi:Na(+)/H(+) exchange regulatory cofactor NHE-RF1 [Lucilia sericata]|uniref:Na(+)/H(+) exchange regulatory cofactor NHE-RF1 n=1 Tax=Lucilia sericata TaxID=13632 RepID=UPI0018A85DF9|nr:Na(+)/H(+) exchange regulatory cofactor NHE-RF1 [Lucilia sericata]
MSQTEMKASSPTPSSASTPDVINKAATKLCHIVKRPDFDGYGFNLHSEKAKPGQFIGKVDANSPAEAAGLKEGDRIIEVNGVAINSETHKQVVQRIKAVSGEVRLLLVDVEGKGDGLMFNGQQSNGKTAMETSKTEQVLPGASENINSITMVSTKRPSQESQRSSAQVNNNSMDVTDKAVSSVPNQAVMTNNNNNIPPPPSATMATSPSKSMMNNNISNNSSKTPLNNSNGSHTEMAAAAASGSASGNGTTIKAGSLQLPMTAAEMRAKLMMKKKYDPKNESVDLKKKYEIVQKL